MIQELLGGNSGLISGGGERNKVLSMNNIIGSSNGGIILEATTTTTTVVVPRHHSSPSPSSSSVASGSVAEKKNNNNKLRCPRCDSANTKFCYYNNYNLTQPRHFCKTCRRYWTKGGALRNVPIGGGCRKNKTAAAAAVVVPKLKIPAAEIGSGGGFAGLDPFDLSQQGSGPVLWGSPRSSHLLALLRSATPNPNPSPSDPLNVKEEGGSFGGSHGGGPESAAENLCRGLGMDPVGRATAPLGLWRSNKQPTTTTTTTHPAVQYGHQVGFTLNDHHRSNGNSGVQELYQRLRSSSSSSSPPGNISFYNNNNSNNDQTAVVLTTAHHHVGSTYSSHFESAPVNSGGGGGGGEFGFWNNNSAFSWSDLQQTTAAATNGAYP